VRILISGRDARLNGATRGQVPSAYVHVQYSTYIRTCGMCSSDLERYSVAVNLPCAFEETPVGHGRQENMENMKLALSRWLPPDVDCRAHSLARHWPLLQPSEVATLPN
jgi:hypothetical protein